MRASTILSASLCLALVGCASPTMYYWGDYQSALYSHYKHPEKLQQYSKQLESIIVEAQAHNKPVPPGVFAEYGYVLLQSHHPDEAITYFQREKQHWPESTKLMDKMIRAASEAESASTAVSAGGQ